MYEFTVCNREEGYLVVLESIYGTVGVLHYISDKILNVQNCSTTPRQKPRRVEGAADR
jgi:hypothetical protein